MGTPTPDFDLKAPNANADRRSGVNPSGRTVAIGNALGAILALLLKVAAFGGLVYLSAYMAVRGFEDALDDAAKVRSEEGR